MQLAVVKGQAQEPGAGMKVVGLAVACVFAWDAAAWAQGKAQTPVAWVYPNYEKLKAGWPHEADGSLIYGKVRLDCGVDSKSYAANCKVIRSEPSDPKFEQAALALAGLVKSPDKSRTRAPLDISVEYDTDLEWLSKPTFEQTIAVYPSAANGRDGSAVIHCWVTTEGLMRSCEVRSESQVGLGFGPAALALAPSFLMKPATKRGLTVEAEISIPVSFVGGGGHSNGPSYTVLSGTAWSKAPTIAEIRAEIEKKVGDKFADGKVVFQCDVIKKTGQLSDCVIINTSPGMAQFQSVATSLVSKFKADPEAFVDIKNGVKINLAFSFPDMSSTAWSQRRLTRPEWLQTISPDPGQKLFPGEAVAAGLKTGSATVDCLIAASGALTQCITIGESTPGVGLGSMAQKIAQAFVTNPWTDEGLPADGEHILLPIKMVDAEANPTPAAKP